MLVIYHFDFDVDVPSEKKVNFLYVKYHAGFLLHHPFTAFSLLPTEG